MLLSDDAFISVLMWQLAGLREKHADIDSFIAQHLDNKETLARIVLIASDKMALTLEDGTGHSGSVCISIEGHLPCILHVSTIPVAAKHASWWYGKEFGGYAEYLNKWYQRSGNEVEAFCVLFHFIYGVDQFTMNLWGAYGLLSIAEPQLRWVFPTDCLTANDRAKIGRSFGRTQID